MKACSQGLRALVALIVLALPLAAFGGEGGERSSVRVEVHVTSLTTGEVYLDAGREQGLEPGDRVRLEPAGSPWVEAVILSVTSGSARARLEGDGKGLDVGTPGEVRVPAARLEPESRGEPAPSAPTTPPAQSVGSASGQGPIVPAPQSGSSAPSVPEPAQSGEARPEHPDWSAPPEEWSQDMPLLAPAQAQTDPEREVTWRGFAFVDGQATFDEGQDYSLGRAGVDLEATNLLGHDGVLRVDVAAFARKATVFAGSDEDETRARIDRLSYLWGGDRERPTSLEGGRFLQRMMPEFGVLDGLEATHRFSAGDTLGASVGFLPEWTPEMETGEDLQLAAAWRHLAGASDQLELGLGLQKTWHDGEADRDLAVGRIAWRPDSTWNVHAAAWVDFYGSDEAVKSSGAELTQATFNVAKRFAGSGGLMLFGTHMRYPDLLRNEYRPVEPTELDDFENSRLGASAWHEVARKVRVSGRLSVWADDEDDGLTGQLRLGVRDRILPQGELALAVFGGDGKYSRVTGARLSASRSMAHGWWTLGVESALHKQDGFIGEQEELWQHVLRGSYDTELGDSWDLSLWGDQRFGDEQQATTVGFSLRRRF